MDLKTTHIPLIGAAILLTAVACNGSNLTLPADGLPTFLRAVSGNGQEGTVGAELAKPLVVEVMDAASRPLRDVSLRFQTQVPAALIKPAEIETDERGHAAVRVWLGSKAGTQIIEALLADDAGSGLKTTFALSAVAAQDPEDRGGGGGGGGRDDDGDDHAGNDNGGNGNGNGQGGGRGRGHDNDEGHDDDHHGGGHHGGGHHGGDEHHDHDDEE